MRLVALILDEGERAPRRMEAGVPWDVVVQQPGSFPATHRDHSGTLRPYLECTAAAVTHDSWGSTGSYAPRRAQLQEDAHLLWTASFFPIQGEEIRNNKNNKNLFKFFCSS